MDGQVSALFQQLPPGPASSFVPSRVLKISAGLEVPTAAIALLLSLANASVRGPERVEECCEAASGPEVDAKDRFGIQLSRSVFLCNWSAC